MRQQVSIQLAATCIWVTARCGRSDLFFASHRLVVFLISQMDQVDFIRMALPSAYESRPPLFGLETEPGR